MAPQKHQYHQTHAGFVTFFGHRVVATIWPFLATRNPPRDRFLRRRSNVIKIMVWTQIRPLETPPAGPNCQYYQGRVQKAASAARSQFSGILRNDNSSYGISILLSSQPQKCTYLLRMCLTQQDGTRNTTLFLLDLPIHLTYIIVGMPSWKALESTGAMVKAGP